MQRKAVKMSRLLTKYDPYDVPDNGDMFDLEYAGEMFSEDLSCIIDHIFEHYDSVFIRGSVGRWDGPSYGELILTKPEDLKRFICDACDIIEISLVEEDEEVSEIQRFSHQWSLSAKKGEILIEQWHHDGCNMFLMRPMKNKKRSIFKPEDLPW